MFKYFNSNPSVSNQDTPKDTWIKGFQANVDAQFYNSPDAFIIKEELTIGKLDFKEVEVRVNRGINTYTGEKLGDDFKLLLFKDLSHSTSIGYKYYFDNNYWIVINSEIIKNFAASCMVRRCNNVLRWIDEYGNYYEEPCIINYNIEEPRDKIGTAGPVMPSGSIDVYSQVNDRTKKIKGSQRFLFGIPSNRIGYKVFGDGVRNFLNQKTADDESSAMLVLSMGGNFVNSETDDVENGIADANKIVYSMSLYPSVLSGSATESYQLTPIVTYNGNPANVPISFSSSASSVASVDDNGLVNFNSNGTAVITSFMTKNTSVKNTCSVVVSASPVTYYEIRIDPDPTFILEGSSQTYNLYLYQNGNLIPGSFAFIDNNIVPANHYNITTTGSSITVRNLKKYLNDYLSIDCISGTETKQMEIYLKGSW